MEPFYEDDHEEFRRMVRTFVEREVLPNLTAWDEAHRVDRDFFRTAGAAGLLGTAVPEEYGGGGVDDFRFNMVIGEEFARVGATSAGLSLILHNDVVLPYLLHYTTDELFQLVAVPGFWIVETRGLQILYMVVSGFLAGLFVPIWLFPGWLEVVAQATPFPATMMYPVDVISGRASGVDALVLVGLQVVWLVGVVALGQVLTRAGRHRLEVQGG